MVTPGLVVEVDPVAGTADIHASDGQHLLAARPAIVLVKHHGDDGILVLVVAGRTVEAAYVDYPSLPVPPATGPGTEPGWISLSAP